MSKILITDFSRFENSIHNLENSLSKLKEVFNNQRINTEKINATDTWTSKTQEVIYNKQKELEKNFNPVEESLQLYINFMKKTLEDYKRLDETIVRSAENNSENLSVNS